MSDERRDMSGKRRQRRDISDERREMSGKRRAGVKHLVAKKAFEPTPNASAARGEELRLVACQYPLGVGLIAGGGFGVGLVLIGHGYLVAVWADDDTCFGDDLVHG
jgi:hypothetical protein